MTPRGRLGPAVVGDSPPRLDGRPRPHQIDRGEPILPAVMPAPVSLPWHRAAYFVFVIALGVLLVPLSLALFPIRSDAQLLELLFLAVLTQVASLMPIKWTRGSQTVDTMPLVAASLLAPGVGPALLAWLCKFDGRWPSAATPTWKLLFNRAKTATEFAIPSMLLTLIPLPADFDVPFRTLGLAAGTLLIGYPITAKALALLESDKFTRVLTVNIGLHSIRSVVILCVGGGALFMVLQIPGGYVMGLGLLGLLFAVRSNIADVQRQHVERIQTLELLAQALDARDPMTELHSERVSNLASQIAHVLGMSEWEVERIRMAGLLHDVGKIGVPDSVLQKPTKLSPTEWQAMKRHADAGADMIARHSALRAMAPWVRHHHERWDGSGYPGGLVGGAIPLGARILAVADSFDTITGPRVYRASSMSADAAVENISSSAGILYDPVVVNALRQVYGYAPVQSARAGGREETGQTAAWGLLRSNARLRWLGLGMSISGVGDPLTTVAVTVSAYSLTRNGLAVGAAMVLRAAAMMLAGTLLAGAADRWPRRTVIVAADTTQFCALLATPLLLTFAPWTLFVVVVVLGGATALGQAGREASLPDVVSVSEIGVANSLIATGTTLGRAVGYPLAALLIWLAMSTAPLYLIDALTFAAAAGLTLAAGPLGGGLASRYVAGAFRRAIAVPEVRRPLVVAGLGGLMVSIGMPVVIVLANQLTSNGARAYTVLEIVLTVGMTLGAISFSRFGKRPETAVLTGLVLMGLASVAVAASPVFVFTAALLFVGSIGNQLYVIGNRTELQQLAPRDRIGSVMAARGVLVQTMAIAGGALGGAISTLIGGRNTYGVSGLAILGLVAGLAIFFRSRRGPATDTVGAAQDSSEHVPVAVRSAGNVPGGA